MIVLLLLNQVEGLLSKMRKVVVFPVEQGAGTGYFFGTDSQNSGAILTSANVQNNLSVAFDGDDLVINHAAAGGVDLTNYTN